MAVMTHCFPCIVTACLVMFGYVWMSLVIFGYVWLCGEGVVKARARRGSRCGGVMQSIGLGVAGKGVMAVVVGTGSYHLLPCM